MSAGLTREEQAEYLALDELLDGSLYKFQPRPNRPELYDQQTGFLESRAKVSVCLGGTGSGKTETAAQKAARFILWDQPPPVPDTPFFILSDTYRQVGNICWKEKLSRIIPGSCVDWERCEWWRPKQNLPLVINLKKWPGTVNNWSIEFRALEQGREAFQGRSIGGFWLSEQFAFDVFEELQGRCRDNWFDGGQFVEFTPIDPDLAIPMEEKFDEWVGGKLADWAFFRLNSNLNDKISATWRESYWSSLSAEILATRQTGAFPGFLGQIFQNFNPAIHALDDEEWNRRYGRPITGKPGQFTAMPGRYCDWAEFKALMPVGVWYRRGIDWGESTDHPFVTLWGFKDGAGNWAIFDEYVEDTGTVLYSDRREEIKNRWPWPLANPYFGQTYADPSRPMLIQEFSNDGIPASSAHNSVDNGIEYVRKLLKVNRITRRPQLVIHKGNCPRLIKEMRKYRWVRGVTEGKNPHVARAVPLKWSDDTVDALRYLTFSDRAPPMDTGPQSLFVGGDPGRHGVRGATRR